MNIKVDSVMYMGDPPFGHFVWPVAVCDSYKSLSSCITLRWPMKGLVWPFSVLCRECWTIYELFCCNYSKLHQIHEWPHYHRDSAEVQRLRITDCSEWSMFLVCGQSPRHQYRGGKGDLFGLHGSPFRSGFVSQWVRQSVSERLFTMFPLKDLYETYTVHVSW